MIAKTLSFKKYYSIKQNNFRIQNTGLKNNYA